MHETPPPTTNRSTTVKITSADGTAIAFEVQGSGPPLIMVYGELGPAKALAAELAKDFTVYRYDRRGRGQSGDATAYAVDREIEDIAALIHHAGGRASLLGLSSGGVLALEAAA